ncbi:MAG: polysaccharide deacetylase family protein [Ferruginibacter sp.]|nr:polysaccharide deacetylase family protein [Chitinophagaceae bacterium]
MIPASFLRIKQKLRFTANDIICGLGMGNGLLKNRPGGRIIVYHGIDENGSTAYNTRFINQELFERQIIYFKQNFNIVTLQDYYAGHFNKDRLTIAITFDDGYANNFTRALPILEKYRVPATFFVTAIRQAGYEYLWCDFYDLARDSLDTININGEIYIKGKFNHFVSRNSGEYLNVLLRKRNFQFIAAAMHSITEQSGFDYKKYHPDHYLQMTEAQLQKLAASPFASVGVHGYYHTDLTQIPFDDAVAEMKNARQWLENITGKVIDSIGFPFGAYDKYLVYAAMQMGFRFILPSLFLQKGDEKIPAMRQRFGVNPFLSLNNQIICLIKESYT